MKRARVPVVKQGCIQERMGKIEAVDPIRTTHRHMALLAYCRFTGVNRIDTSAVDGCSGSRKLMW